MLIIVIKKNEMLIIALINSNYFRRLKNIFIMILGKKKSTKCFENTFFYE